MLHRVVGKPNCLLLWLANPPPMSNLHPTSISITRVEEEEIPQPQRPPSPPFHTTFAARGLHVCVPLRPQVSSHHLVSQAQNFPAHKPRDLRIPSPQAITHVAWNCDGKRLAAVGIDKITRVWNPETSVSLRSLYDRQIFIAIRWSSEQRHTSLVVTLTMSTTCRGILFILTCSAPQVKRIDGWCFGMHDVGSFIAATSSY